MKTHLNRLSNSVSQSQSQSHLTSSNIHIPSRPSLKMVPSIFEPPQQTQPSSYMLTQKRSQPSLQLGSKPQKSPPESQTHSQHSYTSKFNPNIEFISSLVSLKQLITFDEGDCIPIDTDDRWVVVTGEVRVVGVNFCSFGGKEGFVFFASAETKRKVKEVVAVSATTAFRIPHLVFKQNIRNYLYIKNSQKIKFLQYCPFLTWTQSLSQDIAIVMQSLEPANKDIMIYKEGDEADYLYFVKEGIVLLERMGKTCNQIILDFQKHYETSYLSDEEGLIIVRKGMIFGVDGILIKEINKEVDLLENHNPENSSQLAQSIVQPYGQKQQYKLKTTRIYNAKSIGKCQLYRIDKNILETYLKSHGSSTMGSKEQPHMSNKQLDRICLEYTNLLMGSSSVCKEVRKKNFQFKIQVDQTQMESKRKKVEEIKLQEKKIRKVHQNSEHKKYEPAIKQSQQFPILIRSPRKSKGNQIKAKDVSLPSLNKKYVQSLIYKKLQAKQAKQAQKYIGYKKKIEATLLGKDTIENPSTNPKKQKQKQKQKKAENIEFMKVKSYRSLLSSLGQHKIT